MLYSCTHMATVVVKGLLDLHDTKETDVSLRPCGIILRWMDGGEDAHAIQRSPVVLQCRQQVLSLLRGVVNS